MKIWFNKNLIRRMAIIKLPNETMSEFIIRVVRKYVNKKETEKIEND